MTPRDSDPTIFTVDRLWPDPAAGLELDAAMADFIAPEPPADRPSVAVNMVTSVDGRAQRDGTAEGIGSRADRRLLRLYRAAFDAVVSGAGTLRGTGAWLRVGPDLAERRAAAGQRPNPLGVVVAGEVPVPIDARWFAGDEPRLLAVGAANPLTEVPPGTELLRAPTARPEPDWLLAELAARDVRHVLLEGGPTLNAAFLAAGRIDELYWTVGALLLANDALPMIAPLPAESGTVGPARLELRSAHRHGDELFLRYRVAASR